MEYQTIAPAAAKVIVKSSQDAFWTMHNFEYALFASARTTSPKSMAPTITSVGPLFSGFAKLGVTPGGGARAGNCR